MKEIEELGMARGGRLEILWIYISRLLSEPKFPYEASSEGYAGVVGQLIAKQLELLLDCGNTCEFVKLHM